MPYSNDDKGNDMSQYSQVNVMSAYVSMIRFAMDKLELYLDEFGDDILFDGLSPFPEDVLGDDTLFAGYTYPWNPDEEDDDDEFYNQPLDKECQCDDCRCGKANKIYADRMSVGNIMDILRKTRQPPKGLRID
tara:strand:- start:696 stop:1094 length:399 start_codon:yes stop_codon:yes gene_type:complete